MARTDSDSWNLKTGVGTTATLVAAARAVATKNPDPLIHDPFAEALVRAVGFKLFTEVVDGVMDFTEIGAGWMPSYFGIRSRAFDDFLEEACRAGIRQAVILASGPDCRAYRLTWPSTMAIYEVDQPEVVDWKERILSNHACSTSAGQHSCVGIDLRHDWPSALRQAGFQDSKPTAWIVEGLLVGYLPPAAHDKILDEITALSAPESRIMADHFDIQTPEVLKNTLDDLHDMWSERDETLNLRGLTFAGPHDDPAVYLAARGWVTRNLHLADLFRAAGRDVPSPTELPMVARSTRLLNAVRL